MVRQLLSYEGMTKFTLLIKRVLSTVHKDSEKDEGQEQKGIVAKMNSVNTNSVFRFAKRRRTTEKNKSDLLTEESFADLILV